MEMTNLLKEFAMNDAKATIEAEGKTQKDIEILLKLNQATFADEFVKLYGKDFLRLDGSFYYYNGNYWKIDNSERESITICNKLKGDFHTHIMKLLIDNKNDSRIEADFKKKFMMIDNLRNTRYMRDVVEQIKMSCVFDRNIKLDSNINLFAFENIIYDCTDSKFRPGTKEDHISITCGYNYVEPTEEELNTVLDIINKIFPVESEKKLFLEILYTTLTGVVPGHFILANGCGSNGKSLLMEFGMKAMLGNYYYKGNVNSLQTEPGKTCSNPEIANMEKKRLVVYSEPAKNRNLINSIVKDLTGNTEYNARMNYSNKTSVNLHATHIMLCNDKPNFDTVDGGTARRVIDFPFRSLFVNSEDVNKFPDESNVYEKNIKFADIKFWEKHRCALFKILLDYKNDGDFAIPNEIVERSNIYLNNSDFLQNWFNENYVKSENAEDYINITDIYQAFKFSDYYINMDKKQKRDMNKTAFLDLMETHYIYKRFYKKNHRPCIGGKQQTACTAILCHKKKPVDKNDDDN